MRRFILPELKYSVCLTCPPLLKKKPRLLVILAKIQQSIVETKRDAQAVMGSVAGALIYDENSTSRANSVLVQMDVIPQVIKRLHENPESVIADFEEIRRHCTYNFLVKTSISILTK